MPRLLKVIEPLLQGLLDVEPPAKRVPYQSRVMWSLAAALVYISLGQVPVFGAELKLKSDSAAFFLGGLAPANRGSLAELGVAPMITAGVLMAVLANTRVVEVKNKGDRALLQGATRLVALVLTMAEAVLLVACGMYGDVGLLKGTLIVAQLTYAGALLVAWDQLVSKGYGLGSGVSVFIGVTACESVVASAISLRKVATAAASAEAAAGAKEYQGAIIALIHAMSSRPNKLSALGYGLFRGNLPNLLGVFTTLAVFVLTVLAWCCKQQLPVKYAKFRAQQAQYPIKLLYESNIPLILFSTAATNVYLVSACLSQALPSNLVVRVLGHWPDVAAKPTGGLVWLLLTGPVGIFDCAINWYRTALWAAVTVVSCGWLGVFWMDYNGTSARDVARQLTNNNMVIAGHRSSSTVPTLQKQIVPAAFVGGCTVGVLSVAASLLGAFGGGTGVVLAVTMALQYIELVARETNPQLLAQMGKME